MNSPLANKTIVIVGAAGGLGEAHAQACAKAGACLVLSDSGCSIDGEGADPERIIALGQRLSALGAPVLTDGRRIEAEGVAESLVERVLAHFGQIDGLIYCAGLLRPRPLLAMADEDLDAAMVVQALAAMRMSREVSKAMRKEAGGSIVLTIGAGALQGAHRHSHHAAADGAVAAFVRSAALDLRRHNVRINALSGLAYTRTTADLPMFRKQQHSLTAGQVAKVAVYLLSEAAAHVTGEVVGAAGTRLYGLRMRETAGQMLEDNFDETTVAAAFKNATRP